MSGRNLAPKVGWRRQSNIRMILLLAFLHGLLYAILMPPWGLIDETQHFHYIQYIAEQQAVPTAGVTLISSELADSMFETHRWEKFHWRAPVSRNPEEMGVEGHSYEAYHPFAFYALMSPVIDVTSDNVIDQLFMLRIAVVALSLVTILFVYLVASLFMRDFFLAEFAALLVVAIPERTLATSRLNNDVLLEILAASAIALSVTILARGLTRHRAIVLGVLLALGIWTKLSMVFLFVPVALVFWYRRHSPGFWQNMMVVGIIALGSLGLLLLRNWLIYEDALGFAAFHALYKIQAPSLSIKSLWQSAVSLFGNYWVVWWKGAEIVHPPALLIVYSLLAILTGVSTVGIIRHLGQPDQSRHNVAQRHITAVFASVVTVYAAVTAYSYFRGMIPSIQGRFLLPATLPVALLLVHGFTGWRHTFRFIWATILLLFALDLASLFGNLLPFHYYWSAVVLYGANPATWAEMWGLFWGQLLSDKPIWAIPLTGSVAVSYIGCLGWVLATMLRRSSFQ